MAYVLSATVLVAGTEAQAAALLAAYKHLDTLATPVTEASIRADLETSQVQPFTNDGWTSFVYQMSNLPLDASLLTAAQASIVNTFRAVVEPDPALDCCGIVPQSGFTISAIKRTGTGGTYEHQIKVLIADDTLCSIVKIRAALTPTGGAPALTSPNPVVTLFGGCSGGFREFIFYWVTFGSDPTGGVYNVQCDFYDSDDIIIFPSISVPGSLTMP